MSVVTDYIKKCAPAERAFFNHLRDIVHAQIPDVEETWTYGLATFKYKGKYLIAFAAYKNFVSLYPGGAVGDVLKEETEQYRTGRGTFSFKAENPIADDTLEKVILFCKNDIDHRLKK